MEKELKLLLLEDDPADAALINKLLQRSGMNFTSIVVSDEKEFLKALDENTFDAVLADNALPQYTSLKALEVIKKSNPFVAFILVTGTVSEEFAVTIIQQGADDYILKTNLTRLPTAIGKVVENKQIQKARYVAEQETQELNQQLRKLAAHLQHVREEEQTRIAREIHDELGQLLSIIKINITSADKKMHRSIVEAKYNLAEAIKIIDQTVVTVRRIAAGLRPAILDDLGLLAALEWHSQEFENLNNIRVIFDSASPEIQVEKNIATGIYRIYQEALTNVLRHSGADKVAANVSIIEDQIILSVSDNGRGFDEKEIKEKKTLGLLGMNERILLLNGKLIVESVVGKGTNIKAIVPFLTRSGST